MKKIILSAGVFSLLFAGVLLSTSVSAVESSQTKNVYVGESSDPIYSADIFWGDFQYNWDNYAFKPAFRCDKNGESYAGGLMGGLFSDSNCANEYQGDDYTDAYTWRGIPFIIVGSASVNASVSFTPDSSYSWVTGKFYSNYNINTQTRTLSFSDLITNGQVPRQLVGELWAFLDLEVTNAAEHSGSVASGDKIGTITLTLTPNTN